MIIKISLLLKTFSQEFFFKIKVLSKKKHGKKKVNPYKYVLKYRKLRDCNLNKLIKQFKGIKVKNTFNLYKED